MILFSIFRHSHVGCAKKMDLKEVVELHSSGGRGTNAWRQARCIAHCGLGLVPSFSLSAIGTNLHFVL
jgi:hypothetical protein